MSWAEEFKTKVIDPQNLKSKIAEIKASGKTIVTLNGSFDLMHAGHLHIIYKASKLADVLIIALNSDASIKQYKSKDRPIIPLNERMQMMAALGFVDYVTYFDETDPCALLEIIKPNIHANGAEYGKNCIEAEIVKRNGGKIHIVPLVDGLSTSAIIKKIHQLE
ncbi:MAG TPA: adenylyltransferase/cytidyltransferase family protein [Parachlamydiaceae bacterium]|nr:adenylyltransferase/cytidyltransferase family protein [Parachlamydiaceae bacterium]